MVKSQKAKVTTDSVKEEYYKPVTMYRIAICIGIFVLIISLAVIFAMKRVQFARYHVGLRQALSILSQAVLFANFESDFEKHADSYYFYLVDTLNKKFESINCRRSDERVCHIGPYYSMNNKAIMSDMIYKKGEKIVIDNILFMVNKPRYSGDALLVTVDTNGGNIKPNRLGYDVFVFQIINNRIRAMGNKGTLYPFGKYEFYCDDRSTSKDDLLGVNCAYNAFFDKDYFSKLW